MSRIAIYPGTFDPVTNGHIDIMKRAVSVVDRVVIAVAYDVPKTTLFPLEERVEMIKNSIEVIENKENIVVEPFKGLLVNFAKEQGASIIVRGLRAVSDFEYEFQMACMNSTLDEALTTIFLPASEKTQFISSRFVKEIARLGGDISALVPECAVEKLQAQLS